MSTMAHITAISLNHLNMDDQHTTPGSPHSLGYISGSSGSSGSSRLAGLTSARASMRDVTALSDSDWAIASESAVLSSIAASDANVSNAGRANATSSNMSSSSVPAASISNVSSSGRSSTGSSDGTDGATHPGKMSSLHGWLSEENRKMKNWWAARSGTDLHRLYVAQLQDTDGKFSLHVILSYGIP